MVFPYLLIFLMRFSDEITAVRWTIKQIQWLELCEPLEIVFSFQSLSLAPGFFEYYG
jgi:hypothetical protein